MIKKAAINIFCLVWIIGLTVLWPEFLRAGDDTDDARSGVSSSEERRFPATNIALVEFKPADNIRGEIRIRTDNDIGEAQIGIKKNLHNISAGGRATRILESISVETRVVGDKLQIGIETPDNADWQGTQIGVAVDLEILLPPGRIFQGDSEHFDFNVTGPFREVRISGTYGRILVEEVTVSANLRAEYGTLILDGAQGRIDISNQYGSTTLKNATGLTEPVRVRSERGGIELQNIEGAVDIRADDAPVTISDWTARDGSSQIFTNNSPVNVDLVAWDQPKVAIHAGNAKVTVSTPADFNALVRLTVSEAGGGYIRTRGQPLKVTQFDQYSVEGVAGEGAGLLEVTIEEQGDIMLRGPYPRVRTDEDGSI